MSKRLLIPMLPLIIAGVVPTSAAAWPQGTSAPTVSRSEICELSQAGLVTKGGWQWRANSRAGQLAWMAVKWQGKPGDQKTAGDMHAEGVYVWLNGKPIAKVLSRIYLNTLAFDASGRRLAWWAAATWLSTYDLVSGVQRDVPCDGCESPASSIYASPGLSIDDWNDGRDARPLFSPDGKRILARAKVKGGEVIALDGKPGPVFDSVADWGFDPSGVHFGYIARTKDKSVYVLNHRGISESSPDSQTFQKTRAPTRAEGRDSLTSAARSPDGRNQAVVSRAGEKHLVLVDGVVLSEHWAIPDGGEPVWTDNVTIRWVALEEPRRGRILNPYVVEWIHKVILLELKVPR